MHIFSHILNKLSWYLGRIEGFTPWRIYCAEPLGQKMVARDGRNDVELCSMSRKQVIPSLPTVFYFRQAQTQLLGVTGRAPHRDCSISFYLDKDCQLYRVVHCVKLVGQRLTAGGGGHNMEV
jgi:hypothetical protein